jgi:hypothetical protein
MPNRAPAVESMQCIDTHVSSLTENFFQEILQRVGTFVIKGIVL